jgi:hypothetical protein
MEGRRAFADTYRGGCRAFAGITDSDTDDTPPDANQQTLGQVSAGPFVRRSRSTNADKVHHATSRECDAEFIRQAKRCTNGHFCDGPKCATLLATEVWNLTSIVQTVAHGRVQEPHVASRQRLFTEFIYAGDNRFEIRALKLDAFVRQHIGNQGEGAFSTSILNSTLTAASCADGKAIFCRRCFADLANIAESMCTSAIAARSQFIPSCLPTVSLREPRLFGIGVEFVRALCLDPQCTIIDWIPGEDAHARLCFTSLEVAYSFFMSEWDENIRGEPLSQSTFDSVLACLGNCAQTRKRLMAENSYYRVDFLREGIPLRLTSTGKANFKKCAVCLSLETKIRTLPMGSAIRLAAKSEYDQHQRWQRAEREKLNRQKEYALQESNKVFKNHAPILICFIP